MNTVAIVEDNTVMRNTFRQWIDAAPDFAASFACATAEEALSEIPRLKPDVVLMDVIFPASPASPARPNSRRNFPACRSSL